MIYGPTSHGIFLAITRKCDHISGMSSTFVKTLLEYLDVFSAEERKKEKKRRGSSCTTAHDNTAGETIKRLRPSFTHDSFFFHTFYFFNKVF